MESYCLMGTEARSGDGRWRWLYTIVLSMYLSAFELYILKWIKWCILFLCIFYHNKNKHHITIFVFSESVQDADYVVF